MDPNAALAEIRELTDKIIHEGGGNRHEAESLAYGVAALDEWLSGGAFPPSAWPIRRHAPSQGTSATLTAQDPEGGTSTHPAPEGGAQEGRTELRLGDRVAVETQGGGSFTGVVDHMERDLYHGEVIWAAILPESEEVRAFLGHKPYTLGVAHWDLRVVRHLSAR